MVRRNRKFVSLLLSVVMLLSLMTVAFVPTASAAAGDTVFCEDAANWGTVYCYMWTDGSGNNGDWPGQKMTKGDDGLWSYKVTGDWEKLIFNNGSGTQTADLSYQGSGSCYNNSTGAWTTVDVPEEPTQATEPDSTEATEATQPSADSTVSTDKNTVYVMNEAGWSKVYAYMWTTGSSDENKSWPGEALTSIGEGVWMLEYEGDYKLVIFNNNSGTQTSNLNHPGSGQMYNNKTGEWTIYDPTLLHFNGVVAEPASPQYTGVDIKLSIDAEGGEGALSYKFTATVGTSTTVISDYSADSTVVWTPDTAGTYTITYYVKDEAGNEKSQTASFKVNDINAETKPVVQSVSVAPTNSESSEIQKDVKTVIDVTAGGGNTGTKLLFYKFKITDPNGKIANVPYYTTSAQYEFTPTTVGVYQIDVSVQGSDNSTVTRTYKYDCVEELSAPGELKVTVSTSGKAQVGYTVNVNATASGGVAPYTYSFKVNGEQVKDYSSSAAYALSLTAEGTYEVEVSVKDAQDTVATKTVTITATAEQPDVSEPTTPSEPEDDYLKGDADCDGVVNIRDTTAIQKHVADIIVLTEQGLVNAELDSSGSLTVKDATYIQKYIAGMNVSW